MQTDTTIPLLSWWAVGECGRLWVWHADFRWPKQKHEKFAKINLYYVHKFIEPLAQPEVLQKDITHTHIQKSEAVLAVFDMQISTVASSGCVNTQNNSQSTVAGHGQGVGMVGMGRMVGMVRMAGHCVGLVMA